MVERNERRIDRREALRTAGAAALGWAALPLASGAEPAAGGKDRKRVLLFTRCQGFEHSVVKREGNDLAYCEKILVELGPKHGFEVTATKDGGVFTARNIAAYDAFIFYTSGVLTEKGGDNQPPMTAEGKAAFLEAIAGGKGYVGIHAANDSFHSKGEALENQPEDKRDPYIRMVGGEFIVHGDQQPAEMVVSSPAFPGCAGLGKSFRMVDEWYTHKNFAPDLHVILVNETKDMKGIHYQRPPFPSTWARKHGKGRVFYTSMGHREDVWKNENFLKVLLGGLSWALGEVDADVTPNISAVTPRASTLQPREEKK